MPRHALRLARTLRQNKDHGSRLSASTVNYAVQCLNDDEALKLPGVKIALPASVVGAHVLDRGRPTWLAKFEVEGQGTAGSYTARRVNVAG